MADSTVNENLDEFQKRYSVLIEDEEDQIFGDENRPLSPGEIIVMRNQPKVAGMLLSPSRKSRSDGTAVDNRSIKSKVKYFGSPKMKQVKPSTEREQCMEKRKTLQVLQPSANGTGLVGCSTLQRNEEKQKKKRNAQLKQGKLRGLVKVAETKTSSTESSDSDSSSKDDTKKSNDAVADEIALMISETPSERYWEILAEERRIALQEALQENQRLYVEMQEIKERCEKLEEVASQAEYFASLYQLAMEGETAEDLDSSDSCEEQSKPMKHRAEVTEQRLFNIHEVTSKSKSADPGISVGDLTDHIYTRQRVTFISFQQAKIAIVEHIAKELHKNLCMKKDLGFEPLRFPHE